jgi:CBS domain-containing protein
MEGEALRGILSASDLVRAVAEGVLAAAEPAMRAAGEGAAGGGAP